MLQCLRSHWRLAISALCLILSFAQNSLNFHTGGYLAASYALEYPERVRHLILVDPWGMPAKPNDLTDREIRLPVWVRTLATALSHFNALATVRVAGPWGKHLVQKFRPDLGRRFAGPTGDTDAIYDYIYQCNTLAPVGEAAFRTVSLPFGWARRPMVDRMANGLDVRVPVTFL